MFKFRCIFEIHFHDFVHVNIDSISLKIMVYTYKMTFNDFYRICLRSIVGREAAFFSQKD